MMLAELLATLETRGALKAARVKDLKTSLRYLAVALGHTSLEACPVNDACRDPDRWGAALDTHFQQLQTQGRVISAGTRRNTRNNLRVVFRLAETHGLLEAPLPPRLLTKPRRTVFRREQWATSPYKSTYNRSPYRLPQAQWPPDIVEGWRAYQARCGLRVRETTFQSYVLLVESYLGYIAHGIGRPPVWADLFDVTQVVAFVRWHAARVQRSFSAHGRQTVIALAAMAKVLEHPQARALADLSNGLKKPAPVHIKRNHMVSLATLDAVADAWLAEGRIPVVRHGKDPQYPGAKRACLFQRGLILKLLVRVPLRQRNVREMQFDRHLAQDPQTGHWQLTFHGDDLKVGHRGAEVNTYHVDLTDYCPEWLPLLEEWRAVHRPKLPNAATSPFVFLTQRGNPRDGQAVYVDLKDGVGMLTGQRFYPHLIRTIWATECLEKTQDFQTAATMLGDTLAVVMKTYYDVVHKDYHVKAKAFLSEALRTG